MTSRTVQGRGQLFFRPAFLFSRLQRRLTGMTTLAKAGKQLKLAPGEQTKRWLGHHEPDAARQTIADAAAKTAGQADAGPQRSTNQCPRTQAEPTRGNVNGRASPGTNAGMARRPDAVVTQGGRVEQILAPLTVGQRQVVAGIVFTAEPVQIQQRGDTRLFARTDRSMKVSQGPGPIGLAMMVGLALGGSHVDQ